MSVTVVTNITLYGHYRYKDNGLSIYNALTVSINTNDDVAA